MPNSKEVNYNSKRRAPIPLKNEDLKVLKIFKTIKGSNQYVTYGKFTSIWFARYPKDFYIGGFRTAVLCGGGHVSDKKLESHLTKLFDDRFRKFGKASITEIDEAITKINPWKPIPSDIIKLAKSLNIIIEEMNVANPSRYRIKQLHMHKKSTLPLEQRLLTIEEALEYLQDQAYQRHKKSQDRRQKKLEANIQIANSPFS